MKDYWDLLTEDLATFVFLIGLIALLFHPPIVVAIGLCLAYLGLDCLGYYKILMWNGKLMVIAYGKAGVTLPNGETLSKEDARKSQPAYRIIQHGIFIPIFYLVYRIYGTVGILVILVPVVFWFTGFFEIMYYFALKLTLPFIEERKSPEAPITKNYWKGEWEWLTKWTWIFPAGLICKVNKTVVKTWGLVLNILLGFIVEYFIIKGLL